jgi:hypothetical protein
VSVDGEAVRTRIDAKTTDEPGWEVDPDDHWALAVVATVGRQLRLRQEAVGMRGTEFSAAVGYGDDLVYKIESGKRIPRPEYLDAADEVLSAGGLVSAMKEDVEKVQYPKKVRDLAQLEARAAELQLYDPLNVHGLLQTPEYARGVRTRAASDAAPRLLGGRGGAVHGRSRGTQGHLRTGPST